MASTQRQNVTRQLQNWVSQSDSGWANSALDATKGKPAIVTGLYCVNAGASTVYFMLFDASSLPANSTVPTIAPIPVAAGASAYVRFGEVGGEGFTGLSFSTGLVWASSTTSASLTLATGTATTWLQCRYF